MGREGSVPDIRFGGRLAIELEERILLFGNYSRKKILGGNGPYWAYYNFVEEEEFAVRGEGDESGFYYASGSRNKKTTE